MPTLSDQDQAILALEKKWWRYEGAKQQAIRDQLDLTPTRYYHLLNGLLDDPAALAAEPVVVSRLRRQRHARRAAIFAGS